MLVLSKLQGKEKRMRAFFFTLLIHPCTKLHLAEDIKVPKFTKDQEIVSQR